LKIIYNGSDVVDIPGVDGVQPGQTVEVSDAVGQSLLTAGSSIAADGKVVAPPKPLWTAVKKSAEAGKDTP
jgi:hypothetical protein